MPASPGSIGAKLGEPTFDHDVREAVPIHRIKSFGEVEFEYQGRKLAPVAALPNLII